MDYKKKYLKYKLKYLNIRKLYGGAESSVSRIEQELFDAEALFTRGVM